MAIAAIIWAVVIIMLLDVICIVAIVYIDLGNFSYKANNTLDIAQERTLLSTGLSLIGIAISVWATLNILNALDKKDVEELNDQVEKLTKKLNDQDKQLENTYTKLSDYKKDYEDEIEKIKVQSKNTFLYHIEQNACDYSMAYLAKKFVDIKDAPYSQLSIVMLYYSRVYQLYNQQADKKEISGIAKDGIDYTKKLLESNQDFISDVNKFLHFCLAELYFYLAYCYRGEERYTHSVHAITEYDKAKGLFDVSLPEYNPRIVYTDPYDIKDFPDYHNRPLLAYWCNTYGECYSKAVQGYNYCSSIDEEQSSIDTMRKKAVFFCAYAVRLTDKKNQTYLRNLGCAIEAAFGYDAFEGKIAENVAMAYQDAMDVCIKNNHIPNKVFYTWLSFYHKCFDHKIKILRNGQSECEWLDHIETLPDNELPEYFKNALAYSELAYKTYPDSLVFLKFHAFVLRDLCIWEIKCSGKSELACAYYEKFIQVLQTLKVFCMNNYDQFMTELTNWHEYLTEVNL